MEAIYQALMEDLKVRGKFDVAKALKGGVVRLEKLGARYAIYIHFRFYETWQFSTSLLYYQMLAKVIEEKEREKHIF